MYRNGARVAKDFGKACELFRRAMDGGHREATRRVAYLHTIRLRDPQDFAQAIELYDRASDGEDLCGCVLATTYIYDDGVARQVVTGITPFAGNSSIRSAPRTATSCRQQ